MSVRGGSVVAPTVPFQDTLESCACGNVGVGGGGHWPQTVLLTKRLRVPL
jgi:hypothetical protein